MSTARNLLGGAGTQTSALGFGGQTTGAVTNTEEFTGPSSSIATARTLTTSA